MRRTISVVGALLACASLPAMAAGLPAADKAAIFKAAGFTAKSGKYVRCADDNSPSYVPGSIEMQDLNGDGKPEAWVRESSTSCYGMTGEMFVLLGKDAASKWSKLLDEVGIADVKTSKHGGWPDIEVGGPGMGPFPVFRWNGKKYVGG